MNIPVYAFVLIIIGLLIGGLVAGFFISRYLFKRELKKNPPINEKMIRAIFRETGRTPSEAQIRRIMKSIEQSSK